MEGSDAVENNSYSLSFIFAFLIGRLLQTIAITMQAIGLCICVYIYDIVSAIVNEKLVPVY